MHKNISKAIAGSLMSAAMLATAVTGVLAPMSAFAGQQLGQTDFEDGTSLPWHCSETPPAKQSFEVVDGKLEVTIGEVNSAGAGRWDLQLRHRGIKIEAGHTYEISGEVTPDADGWIYCKISDYSGDTELWNKLGGSDWSAAQIKKGETLKFKDTFTASQTISPAEFTFHYADGTVGEWGKPGETGMPAGSKLVFDNLSLIDTTSDANDPDPTLEYGVVRPQSNVRVNQVGYYENLNKKASYVTDASSPLDFDIVDGSGKVVYSGKTKDARPDENGGTPSDMQVEIDLGNGKKELRDRYKDSGAYTHIIDFSDFKTPGNYKIVVHDTVGVSGTRSGINEGAYDTKINGDKVEWTNWKTGVTYAMNESHEFTIGSDIYDGLVADSFNYFYQNRSGIPIEEKYITSGDKSELAHSEYGHNPDEAYVQPKWVKQYKGDFADGDKKYSITATGGWYDAGDHGKYVVNGGVSVWTLQNMYELSKKLGTDSKWTDDKTVLVPEGGDNIPDVLQECKVELDWFFDMIVDSKDPYYGKDAGMVYHKLHDHKWTGLAVHAWSYEEDGFGGCVRIVKPPTYAASLNLAACAAQASRLWEPYDSAYAAKCLEYAEQAYQAVLNSGDGWKVKEGSWEKDVYFAPLDQAIGGGPYGDTYVEDDMYWAACELYATTGKAEYKTMLESYTNPNDVTGKDKAYGITTNLGGGENKGSFSSFNWGCTSGLGTLSLYLNSDKLDDAGLKKVKDAITSAGDEYIAQMAEEGMGVPYKGTSYTDGNNVGDEIITGYEWGSNSFVINNAIVMAYAYDASKDAQYINGAVEAMDYIFGRNGNDFSYVSGYGDVTLQWPHHRLWCKGVNEEFPKAPNGILSGGPGAALCDPYVAGLGFKRGTLAPQKCFVDNAEAWSVNEITINWNSPLVWMSSYLEDVVPTVNDTPGPNPTDPNPTDPPSGDTLWGDANCDGKVTIADSTAILQALGNPDKYGLSTQGAINADVIDNGDGVKTSDALAIQAVDAKLVKQTQFPMTQAEYDAAIK